MKVNVVIGGALILVAIVLFLANRNGLIQNETLSTLDKIASISAFSLAIIVFAWPHIFNNYSVSQTEELAAIENVVNTEVKAAIDINLGTLESIFTPDAVIINRQGTPNDTSDDVIYEGWENIKRYHYVGFQIFYEPDTMTLVDLTIGLNDHKATAVHKGVILNGEYRGDISIYTLEKRNGRWLITQLEFGNK